MGEKILQSSVTSSIRALQQAPKSLVRTVSYFLPVRRKPFKERSDCLPDSIRKPLLYPEALMATLAPRAGMDFYVLPEIPRDLLSQACQVCEAPSLEICGMVNASLQATGRCVLLFGLQGLYYHNDWRSRSPGRGFIAYGELCEKKICRRSWAEVDLGSGEIFDRSGSQVTCQQIVDVLREIQARFVN